MIDKVYKEVEKLLASDNSGHGMNHINRVVKLACVFADNESANKDIVTLIALLHDVDDYKLFGETNLANAKEIMIKCNIDDNTKEIILKAISTIGYSKRISGITPESIEAKVVSDADMCDALGATGILRTYAYSKEHNRPFFDKDTFPNLNLTVDDYKKGSASGVNHIFEKILRLPKMMLTKSGRKEAIKRQKIVVDFLFNLFEEEDALKWRTFLINYIRDNN